LFSSRPLWLQARTPATAGLVVFVKVFIVAGEDACNGGVGCFRQGLFVAGADACNGGVCCFRQRLFVAGEDACNGGVGFIISPKGINVYSKTPPLYLATPKASL